MCKLAVITDEVSQHAARAAAMVQEVGGEGLEIRSVWEKSPHELSTDEMQRLKRIADDYGLRICGIASPVYKCHYTLRTGADACGARLAASQKPADATLVVSISQLRQLSIFLDLFRFPATLTAEHVALD